MINVLQAVSSVIDTPTDNFSGSSASVDIGNNFFNAPNFFLGVIVGIICCFAIKGIYNSVKKHLKRSEDTNKKDKQF